MRRALDVGVALLAHVDDDELDLPEVMDRLETVTSNPTVQREILRVAERRGTIDRHGPYIFPSNDATLQFERDVVSKEGKFVCRRCGAGLSTGYFMQFDAGEHGPFGSTCIKKVIGNI